MNAASRRPRGCRARCPTGCRKAARPPADFDPAALAKTLLRSIRAGTLATLDRNTGHPFASLVNVATDLDGSPVILTSRLSTHTANLEADGRASVLLGQTGKGDPLAHPRLTVLGAFARIEQESADERARAAALPRAPSEGGALCGLRRLFVLAHECRLGASQWRLRARRRSESRGRAHGYVRRRTT